MSSVQRRTAAACGSVRHFLRAEVGGCLWAVAAAVAFGATVPVPLAEHPGHVFAEGERLEVSLPSSFASCAGWRLCDAEGRAVSQGVLAKGAASVSAGTLPVGWYRLEGLDAAGRTHAFTTAAVLARLRAPTPATSPVCIDTANAWFTRTGRPDSDAAKMRAFASLAALAGVSGVRDRLTWGDLEPAPGSWVAQSRYDESARVLSDAGLRVLQVFHGTPGWACTPGLDGAAAVKRYPRDLRDQYRFCRALAARFKGRVQAWEPWNEANIAGFGGHTSDEMCSLQKASFLGFKAGDPDLTVCWNVYAGPGTTLHTQGVLDNAAWPYFDTYNIHSYSPAESYLKEFATARTGACGRPLWISECGIHVNWSAAQGDLSDAEEERQARFVPQSYASSLFAGVSRHYFFILGNYCEGQVQFGLLRHDLTPRRGYLALAAVGRLLADAQPLGRLTNGALRVYAFRAKPDGAARDVLVAWSRKGRAPLPRLGEAAAVFDAYGRALPSLPESVDEAPVFAVLADGSAAALPLEAPCRVGAAPQAAEPSPVVLQTLLPQPRSRLDVQAHQVEAGRTNLVPIAVYNFGPETVRGRLSVGPLPSGWRVALDAEALELRPMERQVVALRVAVEVGAGRTAIYGQTLTVRGAFGAAGSPVLAFRLACEPGAVPPARLVPVASARLAGAWTDNIVGGARMTHELQGQRMVFTMDFRAQDPWGYPRLRLGDGERAPADFDGVMADVEILEGEGELRAQFLERGGAAYLADLAYDGVRRGRQTVVALFDQAAWGPYSRPDADGALSASEIDGLLFGINARRNSRVRLAVDNVRWVKY